jgi:hypothetical protein
MGPRPGPAIRLPQHSRARALGLDGVGLLDPRRARVEASLGLADLLRRLVVQRAAGDERCREQSEERLCPG